MDVLLLAVCVAATVWSGWQLWRRTDNYAF